MEIKLFDSHAHPQFAAYDQDRGEMLARCRAQGIGVIAVGTDAETSQAAVELAREYDFLWATVGFHPGHATAHGFDDPQEGTRAATRAPFDNARFENLAKKPRVVAIGEAGLDYFRLKDESEKKIQRDIFEAQHELSKKVQKPFIIHCRPSQGTMDAYEDLLAEVDFPHGAVAHFFVGDSGIAKRFLDKNCYIAFSGVITFAREYEEVVRYVPLDRLLIETDAPYAAPAPYRGKRNEPSYVIEVAKKIAELKGVSLDGVLTATRENTKQFFMLQKNKNPPEGGFVLGRK